MLAAKVVELSGKTLVTVGMLVLPLTVVVVLSRRVVVVVLGIGNSSEPLFSSTKERLVRLKGTVLVVLLSVYITVLSR